MTQPVSIMPCLDTRNGRVVKGVHFVDIRDAGDPVECAQAYCAAGANELAFWIPRPRSKVAAPCSTWPDVSPKLPPHIFPTFLFTASA
jgi:hypothetical protein